MGRRRSAALRDTAGVYHVASRLASEGFHTTVARGSGAGADVLVGLSGSTANTALTVWTTECPPGFGDGAGGKAEVCEWRVGKETVLADASGSFVALVDLRGDKKLPRIWVLPSTEMSGRFASQGDPGAWIYGPSAAELAPHEEDWDTLERHLLGGRGSRPGWFDRQELAERYGEEFVEALDTESSRLLGVQGSTIVRMADERFPAEDLADASALLSILFRRWMEGERQRRLDKKGGEGT